MIAVVAFASQQGDRVFAMIARCGDKLIEDAPAVFLLSFGIALLKLGEELLRGLAVVSRKSLLFLNRVLSFDESVKNAQDFGNTRSVS